MIDWQDSRLTDQSGTELDVTAVVSRNAFVRPNAIASAKVLRIRPSRLSAKWRGRRNNPGFLLLRTVLEKESLPSTHHSARGLLNLDAWIQAHVAPQAVEASLSFRREGRAPAISRQPVLQGFGLRVFVGLVEKIRSGGKTSARKKATETEWVHYYHYHANQLIDSLSRMVSIPQE